MSQLAGSLPAFARRSSVTSRHTAAGAGSGVRLNDRSASRTRTSLENVPIPFSDVYGTVRSHATAHRRSEEHTSELQSLAYLVCRLLLEKKKKNNIMTRM